MRRDDKKQQTIHKQRIWPTVIVNLLLSALLAAGGFFGIIAFGALLLRNSLRNIQDDQLSCTSLVNDYCAERLSMVASAASLGEQMQQKDVIGSLVSISGCDEAGWIESGSVTVRTGAQLSGEDASTLYSQTQAYGGGVFPMTSGGLAYTAKSKTGVVYLLEAEELSIRLDAASIWGDVDSCLIVDAEGRPILQVRNVPENFDYASIHAAGLVYTPMQPITREDLLRFGIIQGSDVKSIVLGLLSSADLPVPIEEARLSVSLWFENDLNIGGCRLLSHTQRPFERFHVRELLLFSALAAVISFLPLLFMCGTIISKLIYNHGLKQALLYDPVTGGNNFQFFKQRASRLLKKRRYHNCVPAFVVIDMSRFRAFSDIHGNDAGELLLLRIYNTLRRMIVGDELITRYAIDQFSLLLLLNADEDPTARVERMLSSLRRLYPGERLAYSAGVYIVSDRDVAVDRMQNFASVAKDAAKYESGDGVVLFTTAMRDRLISEQQLSSLMDKALKSREFVLFLQPKYAVNERKLCGAEALVRWSSRERGFISPGDFIPLFEKNGFIMKLDEYMLGAVAEFQHSRLAAGKPVVPISVNISRANFSDPAIAKRIKTIVDRYNVPHELIELELTESAFFDDKTALLYTVKQLKRAGFLISMDDFGSGYSSLNSLKDLPLDVVKLDKEFFHPTGDLDRSEVVIRDTIALAKKLDMTVVAEGIETAQQVEFLQTTSCDLIQGFYFARPMPANEYENLVDDLPPS